MIPKLSVLLNFTSMTVRFPDFCFNFGPSLLFTITINHTFLKVSLNWDSTNKTHEFMQQDLIHLLSSKPLLWITRWVKFLLVLCVYLASFFHGIFDIFPLPIFHSQFTPPIWWVIKCHRFLVECSRFSPLLLPLLFVSAVLV